MLAATQIPFKPVDQKLTATRLQALVQAMAVSREGGELGVAAHSEPVAVSN
jgi:hypothetical protein